MEESEDEKVYLHILFDGFYDFKYSFEKWGENIEVYSIDNIKNYLAKDSDLTAKKVMNIIEDPSDENLKEGLYLGEPDDKKVIP